VLPSIARSVYDSAHRGWVAMNYKQLDSDQIVTTAEQLCRRIRERFPTAGLNNCSGQLL